MTNKPKEPEMTPRDGTSQAGRVLGALDPGYVSVDERTVEHLLAFASEYGKGLKYYRADGEEDGTWSAFVNPNQPETDEQAAAFRKKVAAFLNAPEKLDPETSPELFRPHFVLFLAFLQLFRKAQAELNTLTGRHLDFYYQRVLRMVKKGPIPDRVNLLFDLAKSAKEILVPAGSLLGAGPDSLGKDRFYATDHDIVVNRIQIAKLRTAFVEKRRTTLRQAWERRDDDSDATKKAVCLTMFEIALGHPLPGDPLPPYLDTLYPDKTEVKFDKLLALDELVERTNENAGFFLTLSEIRDLMGRKAFAEKSKDVLSEQELTDQWTEINQTIALAAGRAEKSWTPPDVESDDFTSFTKNVLAAVGEMDIPPRVNLEAYWAAIRTLETYFFMSAEAFHDVMKGIRADKPAWDRVEPILESAHKQKVRKDRIDALRQMYQPDEPLEDLIPHVLGEDAKDSEAPATLEDVAPFLSRDDFAELLSSAADLTKAEARERVYSLLEVAQRNRLGELPAEKVEWLNLVPAEDAPAERSHRALDDPQSTAQWATFGQSRPPGVDAAIPVLGWAISSPILALSEGARTVTLILGFRREGVEVDTKLGTSLNSLPLPLLFEVTTAKGWVECSSVEVVIGSYNALSGTTYAEDLLGVQFRLNKISAKADPIAALPSELADIDSPWPVLRLMLRPIRSEAAEQYYRQFGGRLVVAAHLSVAANGLKALKLQNDETTLNAKKPFLPFGSAPAVGSRLLIGHPEVVTKKLDTLKFHFEWMGAPADLREHYTNYYFEEPPPPSTPPPPPPPPFFTAKVCLVDRSAETDLVTDASLFGVRPPPEPPPATPPPDIYDGSVAASIVISTIPAPAGSGDFHMISAGELGEDVSAWGRYLQWELNDPDFQHGTYPALAAGKALELAADIANSKANIVAADYKVNPPYTPKLKSLTLDYTSSQEIALHAPSHARIFHIHPFGYCDVQADSASAALPFLPRYDNDGELYIGLRDVSPPQTVAILFHMAEGSADPEVTPPPVRWSFLSGNRWQPMAHRLLRDTTRGLLSSGIVELALEPVEPSTLFHGGLYWIRAAAARDTGGICDTLGLPSTQAVSATLATHDHARDHFAVPLPAGALTKLASPIRGIAAVRQPHPSYGGRTPEDGGLWATRSAERLRHKQRALSMWDYERLILERFPQIYKAKCIPASPNDPGNVQVIVIPDIRHVRPFDPFEPKAPSGLLAEIEEYLRAKTPAFASVKVRNARYVAVRVRLSVRFAADGNEGYYTRKLNDEINRFLSPWAYDDGADIVIGGRIYANSIIDFVDRRPYVDYVAGITLFRSFDGARFEMAPMLADPKGDWNSDFVDTDLIADSDPDDDIPPQRIAQPDAVLVAARTHVIDVLHGDLYQEDLMKGIGFMKVELDFKVAP